MIALLVFAVAAALPPLRSPDLSGLDPAVAAQMREMQQTAESREAAGAPPDELAAAYADLGEADFAYGFQDAAADAFRRAAALDPGDPRWPYLLGASLQAAGQLDPAVEAFSRSLAMGDSPSTVPGRIHIGEIRLLQGRIDEAEAVLKKALDDPNTTAAAHGLLGQTALARRDFRAAVDHLEKALAAVPDADRLHYPLAMAYRGLGDRERAEQHLARAGQVGLSPFDPLLDAATELRVGERIALQIGRTAMRAGRYAEAAEEFRKAVAARPEGVEARVDLGAALVQSGDRAGGVEQLREALRLDPYNATAHFNLGSLLAESGPADEALSHLEEAVILRPDDAEARRLLARLLRDQGRPAEALPHYAKAIELDPADEAARLGEAETLVRLGRYAEARKHLEADLRALPGSGLLSHALARLLAASPDLSVRDGARAVELALAVWQARPLAAYAETVALAYAESGRCADAADWQRKAIEAAKQEGQEARIGDLARALSVYERGAPCRP